jgi:hypothetical protein
MPVSCHSISWTPNQVIGVVEMGEGFMADRGERRRQVRLEEVSKREIGVRTDDLMHKHCGALFDVGTPKGIIRGMTRAIEYVEGSKSIYGSRCSR